MVKDTMENCERYLLVEECTLIRLLWCEYTDYFFLNIATHIQMVKQAYL